MGGDMADDYLEGLPPERREELARLNKPGLRALREYLAAREAVARLVPPGLDPDPLATAERLVAEQKAANDGAEGSES